MDLNTIKEIVRPTDAEAVKNWQNGHAWLAGGTWLFSEPQPSTHTLIDVEGFNWPSLTVSPEGLEIAATCKVIELDRFTRTGQMRRLFLSGSTHDRICGRAT